jgi:hypothetical protein
MNLPASIGLSQSASLLGRECTGSISLIELFHLPALTHLTRCLFQTAFADRLPRLTLVAACAVTRLSPRFRYSAAVRLLTESRLPFRLRL